MVTMIETDTPLYGEVNVLDLFAGVGGLSYGIAQLSPNLNIIGAIDFDEDAVNSFNKNHKGRDVARQRDLTQYTPTEFEEETGITPEDVDVVCGGPPCKGFSSIRPGRSKNERDDRNYLYQFYFNFVEYFQPDVFVMENVPQLLTHTNDDGQKIFDSVLDRGEGLGYKVDSQLLNAAHYGVPQVRTRIFLVGTTNHSQTISFPKPEYHLQNGLKIKHRDKLLQEDEGLPPARNIESIIKDLPTLEPGEKKEEYFCEPEQLVKESERSYVEYLRQNDPSLQNHKSSNNTENMRKRLSFAGDTRDVLPEYIFPSSGYSSTYSRLRREEPSSTLTTNFTTASSTRCIHPYENRALSLREGARIQSFPDHFQFTGSKGEIRQQIGNAVPPILGRSIGATVVDLMNQHNS